jgi:hypothetical protein
MIQEIEEILRNGGYCYAGASYAAACAVADVVQAEVNKLHAALRDEYVQRGFTPIPKAEPPSLASPTWPPEVRPTHADRPTGSPMDQTPSTPAGSTVTTTDQLQSPPPAAPTTAGGSDLAEERVP